MKLRSKNRIRLPFLVFLACVITTGAPAQTISEDVPLSFGEIVIRSFASVARVTISPSGGFSTNSNVFLISNPQRGEYSVSGAPADTFYDILLPATILLAGPGGVTFIMDDLAATPGPPYMTDSLGNDSFFISGSIESQGGGTPYLDGTYQTSLPITLVF